MLFLVIIFLIIIWLLFRHEKNKERKERSKYKTKIENYLWIIRILTSKGYTFKDKTGLNTSHVVLTFAGPNGKEVILEHDYTVLNENQGKLFLISGKKKLEMNFIQTAKREDEIIKWLETIA